ncbi:MAG: hypothetical protein ACOX17_01760 [Christensenellales bacterium]|jgi:uncharacterized protein with PQ loop repeat
MAKKKKPDIFKEGVLVTIGSLAALLTAFLVYSLVFMIFETAANRDGGYHFVSSLRIGYGAAWMIAGIILYLTKIPDWVKACGLAGALGTMLTGVGITLHERPIIVGIIIFLVSAICVLILIKAKKRWYHYYAVALALTAALFYL